MFVQNVQFYKVFTKAYSSYFAVFWSGWYNSFSTFGISCFLSPCKLHVVTCSSDTLFCMPISRIFVERTRLMFNFYCGIGFLHICWYLEWFRYPFKSFLECLLLVSPLTFRLSFLLLLNFRFWTCIATMLFVIDMERSKVIINWTIVTVSSSFVAKFCKYTD